VHRRVQQDSSTTNLNHYKQDYYLLHQFLLSSFITIVIPCFNEAARIRAEEYLSYLDANEDINFLFVDDGSTDNTPDILHQLKQNSPQRIDILLLSKNTGKATAVRQGILASFKKPSIYVGYWDADLATPLSEIPRFIAELRVDQNKKMICGSRIKTLGADIQRQIFRHYLGRALATFISIILRLPVYDTQCGAKIIERELAETIFSEPFISPWLFDVELIARVIGLVGRKKAAEIIYELPLNTWHDIGTSKVSLRYLPKIPLEIARIYWRHHAGLNKR